MLKWLKFYLNRLQSPGYILKGECKKCGRCCRNIVFFAYGNPIKDIKLFEELKIKNKRMNLFYPSGKNENGEMLLKLVDGALNKTRKMYILTVNNLDINENMLGRPGRIRYVKQFENLTEKAINDYIKDNLINSEKKEKVLKIIDSLEISTIDVLRNIVEEINIHGDIEENSPLNLPKAKHSYKIIYINSGEQDDEDITRFKELVLSTSELDKWLKKTKDNDDITNEDWVYQEIGAYVTTLTTPSSFLYVGMQTNLGEIVEEPDPNGFFYIKPKYINGEFLCKMISGRENNPSLYRGRLVI